MTRIGLACLCIGALLPPVSLHADPTPTASATLEELKADFEKQDAELNQVYTETMARLPAEQQKELKKSEVEWIKHRDQEGTDPGLNWLILSFKTRERIKDIRADFPLENGPYPPPGYSEAKDEGAESPKGDFVIKVFRGESADSRRQEAWIVSKQDPTQRKRLPGKTVAFSTEHFISPDARWIVRRQHDGSQEDSAYLYRRKDGLVFESITDPLSELAWEFFEKTPANKRKYKIDTKNLTQSFIRFESWSGDGKKVRLSLSGLESHEWTIHDWQCDYSMEKKALELPASLSEHNAKAVEALGPEEVLATINGSDAYTGSGYAQGDEVRITIKPGERFIAAPPYSDFAQRGDTSWHVYLKSGIECLIDRSRIRLLPEEPLMKLNYDASKKGWRKLRAKPVTQSDEAAWRAKQHGVNYYDTLLRASEGDLKAITRFNSLNEFMDAGAGEEYHSTWWRLFHVAGDEIFANYYKSCPKKIRESYRNFFSIDGSDMTDPISKPKPYLKQNFPKTYEILFGKGQ